ncbi:DsbA family protein [Palleronia sp. LCG004]|uniref:DsbA family protein n=1 Tax=Palleronia sp. LCG004 TaxID=3079304 RepID=UPI0029428C18|nr:DsbA family protein [Palleronia sp. LCG004]WOI55853.1 DsbA family protein [Palleronia sp. LCG004]
MQGSKAMAGRMATRRQLLFLGAGVALWAGGTRIVPRIFERFAGFEFIALDRPEGFRALASGNGAVSSGQAVDFMVGLEPVDPLPTGLMDRVEEHPQTFLFDASGRIGATPVAYFFDYYCPYCRVLSGHLSDLVGNSEIALTRHHLPIFGEASNLASRAAIGAELLGEGEALHRRLVQTPVRVTPSYLEEVAEDLGLAWPELWRTMQSPEVTARLDRSRALSRLFAFVGTPALVVGRTLVQGEIPKRRLSALVELERERRPPGS